MTYLVAVFQKICLNKLNNPYICKMKETKHSYKGYDIIGTTYISSGNWVLGGRHFIEGGIKRNYNIKKDGKYVVNPYIIFETLKFAKEEIDRIINK